MVTHPRKRAVKETHRELWGRVSMQYGRETNERPRPGRVIFLFGVRNDSRDCGRVFDVAVRPNPVIQRSWHDRVRLPIRQPKGFQCDRKDRIE